MTKQTLPLSAIESAQREYWDTDAPDYHSRHENYLSGFNWCPELLSEEDAQLLGDVSGQNILEIGCGSAPCSSWLAQKYPSASISGIDISQAMLRQAPTPLPTNLTLIQASANSLPFKDQSFQSVFSAFGAVPFIEDLPSLYSEFARVLVPQGYGVIATNHPLRWIFPDDPTAAGLIADIPYFERNYIERDEHGTITYAEFQHTIADHLNAFTAAGLRVVRCIEPEWPADLTETWGQWSPLRGRIFPGTIIFVVEKLAS